MDILIIAGPNGAGKTTFAREFLSSEGKCTTFINADLIAAELDPSHPERAAMRAGRMMLDQIGRQVRTGRSFALETTLSGRNYARSITDWRKRGYRVRLCFLRLPSPEMAVLRVRNRAREGDTTSKKMSFAVGSMRDGATSGSSTVTLSMSGCSTTRAEKPQGWSRNEAVRTDRLKRRTKPLRSKGPGTSRG